MWKIGYYDYKTGNVELTEFIDCIGKENIIFTDTDGIFFFFNSEIKKKIIKLMTEKQNKERGVYSE